MIAAIPAVRAVAKQLSLGSRRLVETPEEAV